MFLNYPVLVKYRAVGDSKRKKLHSVCVPDLSLIIDMSREVISPRKTQESVIIEKISSELSTRIENNEKIQFPSKLRSYQDICKPKGDLIWTKAQVKVDVSSGYIEYIAVTVAVLSRLLSGLMFAFSVFLSATLVSSSSSILLPSVAALSGLIMTYLIFAYSNAVNDSRSSGRFFDDLFFKNTPSRSMIEFADQYANIKNSSKLYTPDNPVASTCKIMTAFSVYMPVVVSSLSYGLLKYQSMIALGQKARSNGHSWASEELIFAMAVTHAVADTIATGVFEASYTTVLLDVLSRWIDLHITISKDNTGDTVKDDESTVDLLVVDNANTTVTNPRC